MAYTNVTTVAELRAKHSFWVTCVDANGNKCSSFAKPKPIYFDCIDFSITVNISIGGSNPTTPDPCSAVTQATKSIGIASPRCVCPSYVLTSDWCAGTKVIWYDEKGKKLATLTPPNDKYEVGVLTQKRTYEYDCYLKDPNGSICNGSYELGEDKPQPNGRVASVEETEAVEGTSVNNCSATISLAVALQVELSELICQTYYLWKDDPAAYLPVLQEAIKAQYPAVVFPTDNTAILVAMQAYNCDEAARLLTEPNAGTNIGVGEFNEKREAGHGKVLNDVIGKPFPYIILQTRRRPGKADNFVDIADDLKHGDFKKVEDLIFLNLNFRRMLLSPYLTDPDYTNPDVLLEQWKDLNRQATMTDAEMRIVANTMTDKVFTGTGGYNYSFPVLNQRAEECSSTNNLVNNIKTSILRYMIFQEGFFAVDG